MNLDENSTYKLTKIGIKDFTKNRFVDLGDSKKGHATKVDLGEGKYKIMVSRFFDYLITSQVEKVTDQENGNFLIETLNSFYTLEKLANEEK